MRSSLLSRQIVFLAMLVSWAGLGNRFAPAGQDSAVEVEKLLDQALVRNAKQVRVILMRIIPILQENKSISPGERDRLTPKLARVLEMSVRSPAELGKLMGEKASWTIARQIMYRRYREQWQLEAPLRLIAIFEYSQGEEARLMMVRPLPVGN